MRNNRILMTGATGILGSWLLGEALRRGYEPTVLMRDSAPEHALERLRIALEVVGHAEDLGRVHILPGNTMAPHFGLNDATWQSIRNDIGGVVHSAAVTSFSSKKDPLIYGTNVGAMQTLIELLSGTDAPLYHVSTAYIAGRDGDEALEDAIKPQEECRNTYERSKAQAEALVNQAYANGHLQASIYRPSIIVGAAKNGHIHQFLNFYQVLRLADLVDKGMFPAHEDIRVEVPHDATLNLVPVDWVAEAFWEIVEAEGASGRTYHLTAPEPVSMARINEWVRYFLDGRAATMEFVDALTEPLTDTEGYILQLTKIFHKYVKQREPHFVRNNTEAALNGKAPFPEIDNNFFNVLLDYARERDWENAFGSKLLDVQPSSQQS